MAFGCSDVLKSRGFELYSWTLGCSDVLKSRVFDLYSWTLGVGSRIPHGARSLYLITCRYHALVCCKINARLAFLMIFPLSVPRPSIG